jgi:hypothetical protein
MIDADDATFAHGEVPFSRARFITRSNSAPPLTSLTEASAMFKSNPW